MKRAMEADSHPSNKVIGTHSGSFHVDEALACFMLLQVLTDHHYFIHFFF